MTHAAATVGPPAYAEAASSDQPFSGTLTSSGTTIGPFIFSPFLDRTDPGRRAQRSRYDVVAGALRGHRPGIAPSTTGGCADPASPM